MMIRPVLDALARRVERGIGGTIGRVVALVAVSAITLWLTYAFTAMKLQRWFGG